MYIFASHIKTPRTLTPSLKLLLPWMYIYTSERFISMAHHRALGTDSERISCLLVGHSISRNCVSKLEFTFFTNENRFQLIFYRQIILSKRDQFDVFLTMQLQQSFICFVLPLLRVPSVGCSIIHKTCLTYMLITFHAFLEDLRKYKKYKMYIIANKSFFVHYKLLRLILQNIFV